MRTRKVLSMLFGICAVLTLAGCGQSQGEEVTSSPSKDTSGIEAAPSKNDSAPVKNEDEITLDLSENQDFYTLFDSNCCDENGNYSGSFYAIDELTIARRKIDEESGTDDVYVAVVSSSPTSKYTGEFHLLYSLYDVGGWYLENIELESGTLEALSQVSERDAFNIVLNIVSGLGADPSTAWIESTEMISNQEELVVAEVDFNDGIVAVQGSIELYFYFNGQIWSHGDTKTNFQYDILAEGTYVSMGQGYPVFLTINHENGVPVIRRATSWGGGIDPFHIKDWDFDCLSRSYVYGGGVDGDIPCKYSFGSDGSISYYINGKFDTTFYQIFEPITDAEVLSEALKAAGSAWW